MVLRRPAALLACLALLLVGLAGPLRASSADAGALTVTGRTADGWARYRLAEGALPAPALPGVGFRGEVHFVHDGRPRAVRLLVPPGARRPAPLLVSLHGLFQTLETAERDQRWGVLVRREGVVLAYGAGTDASWNAGTCCGEAVQQGVDDVGYLDQVLALARALHPVDARRVHLTGFSNGAMMAYRYACERPQVVAGVLSVGGTVTSDCRGRTDVAVRHVHGVQDRTVPLEGLAYHPGLRSPLRPVSHTTRWFGPRVSAVLLPRYGHGWPTAVHGPYETTRLGWQFLAAHPRR